MSENELPPRFVDAVARAQRVVSRSVQEVLEREEGISLDQWRTMRALSVSGRTMGELVDHLQIPPASVTRLVDGLVDNALVFRHVTPTDRRRIEVVLSDAGVVLLRRLEELVRVHEKRLHALTNLPIAQLAHDLATVAQLEPDEVSHDPVRRP